MAGSARIASGTLTRSVAVRSELNPRVKADLRPGRSSRRRAKPGIATGWTVTDRMLTGQLERLKART